jgi:hypothetical protein
VPNLLFVVGALVIVGMLVDVLWTTVAAGAGAGPLTGRCANALWRAAVRVNGGRSHRFLQMTGVGITIGVIGMWITLLWAGWTLTFLADPHAVVDIRTGQQADGWSRASYTGYTIFTLGSSQYGPGAPPWQLGTAVAAGTGLFLVTLAITYLVEVASGVTYKRQLAGYVYGLGDTPDDIIVRAWNGADLTVLADHFQTLTPAMSYVAQRLLAYPVVHYSHSVERRTAVAPAIAVVDELLTLLHHGVAPAVHLPLLTTEPLRRTVSELLETLEAAFIHPTTLPPPPPCLQRLRDAGIPTVDDEQFQTALELLQPRRRLLLGLVHTDGWPWSSVWPDRDDG